MTVPMKNMARPIVNEASIGLNQGAAKAKKARVDVAPMSPMDGKIMVRPVRVTMRPVIIDPAPIPTVTGNMR